MQEVEHLKPKIYSNFPADIIQYSNYAENSGTGLILLMSPEQNKEKHDFRPPQWRKGCRWGV